MTVEFSVNVVEDDDDLAKQAAAFVADRARSHVAAKGSFTFAVSGGKTPWAMFAQLAFEDVPWSAVHVYQVDERVAPDGDPDRNLTHLLASLPVGVDVHAMPVSNFEPELAAAAYATELPDSLDLVHLGIGPDGHTASLVPGDPVLDVTDRPVGVTAEYMGRQRLTLTYPVLNAAAEVVWLIAGADKVDAFGKLSQHDPSVPAGRIAAAKQTVFIDRAATGA